MAIEPWSKANERGLARYVDPERVKLRLGVSRYDLARQPDGVRRIVEAIYDGLLGAHIRYAPGKVFSGSKPTADSQPGGNTGKGRRKDL